MATASATNSSNPASSLFSSLNGTASKTNSSGTTDAQNRFLTLLTTQLKNQLNPMDNAEVTSQLAQISTVDGIERLNGTLAKLMDSQSQGQTLQAAALVGRGVLVAGSGLALQGGSAIGGFELAKAADHVNIDIKDATGTVVRTIKLTGVDAGVHSFTWDGATDAETTAADGQYTFSIAATQGSDKVTVDRLQLGLVDSVSLAATGVKVNVGGVNSSSTSLGSFGMTELKQIL
ncbi:MAG: flagellar hook assembly protein FlgD [Rhodocyclales bacterium]|nr:flagellar hook assembly protein FlgD [Rhodocyclales bacterium]